jgi:hypothetical protein
MTLLPQPGKLQVFDGPLFLNNGSTTPASAGSLGFAAGNEVQSGWPANTAVVEAPGTSNFLPYRFTLPIRPKAGVLQGSINILDSSLINGSFSGDSDYSQHFTDRTTSVSGSCPVSGSTTGACTVQGLYRLSFYLYSTTTTCSGGSPTAGPIVISYTDRAGSKSVVVPLFSSGAITSSISLTGSAYAWGTATIWSTGSSPIQYQTTLNGSCTPSGQAKYELDATVEQIQ